MPEAATAEEIEKVYLEGWKLGLKAIAIYRDNCKRIAAAQHRQEEGRRRRARHRGRSPKLQKELAKAQAEAGKPHRRRLPSERTAVTHKFDIAGHEGYITVGLYPDGQPGEIFLKMAKEGSTVSGLMDSFATTVSVALQYGVPLRDLVNKFAHVRFEPSGFTGNQEIPIAKSIVDYIFRWLGSRFLGPDDKAALGLIDRSAMVSRRPPFGALGGARLRGCRRAHAPTATLGAAYGRPRSTATADSRAISPRRRSRSRRQRSAPRPRSTPPETAAAGRRRGAGEASSAPAPRRS